MKMKSLSSKNACDLLFVLFLIISLSVGLFIFKDYGQSYDEYSMRFLAEKSIDAYGKGSFGKLESDPDLIYYGPSFIMGASLFSTFLNKIFPDVLVTDFWHLAYFLMFLISTILLYILMKRWFDQWVSLSTTLIYSSQPILWGHSFINPKDIPFMTLFLASIVIGLWMWDKLEVKFHLLEQRFSIQKTFSNLKNSFKVFTKKEKGNLIKFSSIFLGVYLLLALGTSFINNLISRFMSFAYYSPIDSFVGKVFHRIATNSMSINLDAYVLKAQTWFSWGKVMILILGLLQTLWLIRRPLIAFSNLPQKTRILSALLEVAKSCYLPPLIFSAIVLGLTTSTRIIGPLAGLIVGLFGLYKYGRKALLYLLPYITISFMVMYLTWPAAWSHPFRHVISTLTIMTDFPFWSGRVLFNGLFYKSTELPISYLPGLFSIKFTESSLLLILFGITLWIIDLIRNSNREFSLIILLVLILPMSYFILGQPPLYDNFRQILFLIPFMFLLIGLAMKFLFRLIHPTVLKILIVLVALIPSVLNIYALHPYEYVYYNSLIGGVEGAFRKFETDYWFTSYRECTDYINDNAEFGSKISLFGRYEIITPHLRPDLSIINQDKDFKLDYDYVILNSKSNMDEKIGINDAIVFEVMRDNALFCVVKQHN